MLYHGITLMGNAKRSSFEREKSSTTSDENVYSESIANWYDTIMEAGYYDHEGEANALAAVLGNRKRILELGIGTGLLAEQLVKRGFHVTGVDFTEAMLRRAKERLGESVKLYSQNVLKLDVPEMYEAIYSVGGVWVATKDHDGKCFIESHFPSIEDNMRAIQKVVGVLESDGMLLLGIQPIQADLGGMSLGNGAVYSQKVKYDLPLIHKKYLITQNGERVAFQSSIYRRLVGHERSVFLEKGGLLELGTDPSKQFLILRKQ